jgi:SAM-dependent methyltransferase
MGRYDYFAFKKVSGVGKWMGDLQNKNVAKSLLKKVPVNGLIVEIGIGNGKLAEQIRNISSSVNYIGYEPSASFAEQRRNDGFFIREQFIPPLVEDDHSVDVIVLHHVFEHLPDLNVSLGALNEFYRVLKDDGYLVIVCPDLLDFGFTFWDSDYTHQFPTTRRRVAQMGEDQGFIVVKQRFIWGALPWFPGYFMQLLTKILLVLLHPVWSAFPVLDQKASKLRTLFARSFWIEFQRPSS